MRTYAVIPICCDATMLWYPWCVFFHDPHRISLEAGKGIAWEDTLWASSVFWQLASARFCIPTDDRTLAAVADWSVAPEFIQRHDHLGKCCWNDVCFMEGFFDIYQRVENASSWPGSFWMNQVNVYKPHNYRMGQIWYTLFNAQIWEQHQDLVSGS